MKLKRYTLIFFFLGIISVKGQNNDPHGNYESAITGISSERSNIQNFKLKKHNKPTNATLTVYTQDEIAVKETVEQFLIVAGNYNLEAMAEMMAVTIKI